MARIIALIFALSLFIQAAFALNYRDLRAAPIASFNDRDIDMMMENFQDAMDNNSDGQSREWRNGESGHHGVVTPLDTSEYGGSFCRTVRIENYGDNSHAVTRLRFCKSSDGTWQVSE